jgi:predicted nucleic acid-binding protein
MSQVARRVYLDTNMLIYLIDGAPGYMMKAKEAIASFKGKADLFTSEMTWGECLRGALRHGNSGSAAIYVSALENENFITLKPVSLALIKRAAELGAELNMKLIDAIHAATVEALQCDVFLTNDRGIRAPAGIECGICRPRRDHSPPPSEWM